ncbi:MAG: calcium-binding protein [Myxococcota bacterium]
MALGALSLACTDAGLYAAGQGGIGGPDRAEIEARACVPLASGEAFPVKVLYAVEGGANVDRVLTGKMTEALQSLGARFSTPGVTFGLVAFHTVATGLQGQFVDAAQIQQAVTQYAAYQEAGPVSLRAPLKLARSILSGDMQTGCKGTVARTRYVVVLVFGSADTSCANPVFNAGIDPRCNALLPDEAACSACELTQVTDQLKNLAEEHGAGEVVVYPVYVRTTPDQTVSAMGAAIARSGGTSLIETDPLNLANTVNQQISYASLQRALRLKRLVAFNRNSISRTGQLLVDSDGDGVADEEEVALGLDPTLPDSDTDGLMDGVELRMGLRPQPGNVDLINGCNVADDTDGDRLNDCEERVLGTDACVTDSDGDALPDLVELLGGTNPLIPEDLADADRDGFTNIAEIERHTDPNSADIAYGNERAYGYFIDDAPPTDDGRACYDLRIYNIGLVHTMRVPNPRIPGLNVREGNNDIYIYFQVGRENDPRGTGIGSLTVVPVKFIPPATRDPRGLIRIAPEEFVLGN